MTNSATRRPMPYTVYKLLHFFGLFAMIVALSIEAMRVFQPTGASPAPSRRPLLILHGLAAFLVLLGGFGMLARLGIVHGGLPGWVYAKLALWLVVGLAIVLPRRGPSMARALLVALPFLALAGAAVALYKPF